MPKYKAGRGKHYGKIKLFITVYYGVYYGLLQILRAFITEITVFLQGNLFTLEKRSQIRPKTPYFLWKIAQNQDLFITDITEYHGYHGIFFITEYYGKLWCLMFPPV